MPTPSPYPQIEIPNVDLWAFLFEQKDREFPEDKGMLFHYFSLVFLANLQLTPFPQ